MTPKPKGGDTNTRLSVLEYKMDEQKKVSDRTEGKVDQVVEQLNKLSYVTYSEFETFKTNVRDNYVTIESQKGWQTFIKALGTAAAITLISAVLAWVFRGGLSS